MNRNTRTRTIARLAAALSAGAFTLGIAGPAFADTPVQPDEALELADAPECTPWNIGSVSHHFYPKGDNSWQMQFGYLDEVDTCDEFVSLKVYTLASATASIDDPGSTLHHNAGYPLSKLEADTKQFGDFNWGLSEPGECSEFRVAIGGTTVLAARFTDDCTPFDLKAADEVGPDPTAPANPDDLTTPDPTDPSNPDDRTTTDPTQPTNPDHPTTLHATNPRTPEHVTPADPRDPGQPEQPGAGGELPHTGTTSSTLIALAAGFTGLGALVVAGTRRRGVIA